MCKCLLYNFKKTYNDSTKKHYLCNIAKCWAQADILQNSQREKQDNFLILNHDWEILRTIILFLFKYTVNNYGSNYNSI